MTSAWRLKISRIRGQALLANMFPFTSLGCKLKNRKPGVGQVSPLPTGRAKGARTMPRASPSRRRPPPPRAWCGTPRWRSAPAEGSGTQTLRTSPRRPTSNQRSPRHKGVFPKTRGKPGSAVGGGSVLRTTQVPLFAPPQKKKGSLAEQIRRNSKRENAHANCSVSASTTSSRPRGSQSERTFAVPSASVQQTKPLCMSPSRLS